MEKKEILDQLNSLKENKHYTEEQRIALQEAIKIVKKAKTWEQCIKAVEILVKLLAIGSNLF